MEKKKSLSILDKQKNMEKKAAAFRKELEQYTSKYGERMLDEFASYWTEPNRSQTKMRCELQPTWKLSGRLATWFSHSKSFSRPVTGQVIHKQDMDYDTSKIWK